MARDGVVLASRSAQRTLEHPRRAQLLPNYFWSRLMKRPEGNTLTDLLGSGSRGRGKKLSVGDPLSYRSILLHRPDLTGVDQVFQLAVAALFDGMLNLVDDELIVTWMVYSA